jgi:hypothetical protein
MIPNFQCVCFHSTRDNGDGSEIFKYQYNMDMQVLRYDTTARFVQFVNAQCFIMNAYNWFQVHYMVSVLTSSIYT